MAKKKLNIKPKVKLPRAGSGKFTDPRTDSYYTQKIDNLNVVNNLPIEQSKKSKSLKLKEDIQNTPVRATGAIEESLSPIDLIGIGLYKNLAKGVFNVGEAAIQNTWRINPYAFKPTEGMLYRGIGKEGMEDALQSQVFRAKQNVQPDMVGNFDFAKRFKNTYYSPKFNIADSYGNGFIAEVPENAANFANRYAKGKDWSKLTTEQIPINKGKILEKDWLKRYKEVKQPNLSKPQGHPEIIKETKPYNYQFDGQTDKLGDYLRLNTPLDDSYIIKKEFGGNINKLDMAKNGKKIKMKLKKALYGNEVNNIGNTQLVGNNTEDIDYAQLYAGDNYENPKFTTQNGFAQLPQNQPLKQMVAGYDTQYNQPSQLTEPTFNSTTQRYDYGNPPVNNQNNNSTFTPHNSVSGLSQNFQKIGSGAQKMAKGDWKGAISDWGGTEFELAKGFSNIAVAQKTNRRLEKNQADLLKKSLTQPYLNDYNDNQFGYSKVPLSKYGIKLPKANYGIPSKFEGKTHAEGGEPINTNMQFNNANDLKTPRHLANLEVETDEYLLPQAELGTQEPSMGVLSAKKRVGFTMKAKNGKSIKVSPSEAVDEMAKIEGIPTPDKMNKYISKREEFIKDNKNFAPSDTQNALDILLPQYKAKIDPITNLAFNLQEQRKEELGISDAPQAEFGRLMMAKHGKKVKSNYPNINYPQTTEKGLSYGAPNDVDWWNWQHNIDVSANNRGFDVPIPGEDTSPVLSGIYYGTQDPQSLVNTAYQEQSYDDALDTEQGRKALARMWDNAGNTNFGKDKGVKFPSGKLSNLNDDDLKKVLGELRPAYLDSQLDYRKTNYITPKEIKNQGELKKGDYQIPKINSTGNTGVKGKNPNMRFIPTLAFNEPYLLSPEPLWQETPNLIDYRSPDIEKNLLENRKIASLLGKNSSPINKANLFGKLTEANNQVYGNAFNTMQQGKQAVDQFNAQTLQGVQQRNIGNAGNFWDRVSRGRGNLATQQLMDRQQLNENFGDLTHQQMTQDYLSNIYDTSGITPDLSGNYIQPTATTKKKKSYGGKVKLNVKKKNK